MRLSNMVSVYHKSGSLNSMGKEKRQEEQQKKQKNTIPSMVELCYTINVKVYP